MVKYILVCGGVISGVGKGVIASSTGLLLKTYGLKVTAIKIDPYLNVDAGTMAPKEHGEVFVLNDGGEVDLDLGNYERYLNVSLSRDNNITTGKLYCDVINKERKGEYLGKTVQVVPHLTNAVQEWIKRVSKIPVDDTGEEPDVCIIELGGTIGDIESAMFIEALSQFSFNCGGSNFAVVQVSLIPITNGEQKTKPTQATMNTLRGSGIVPNLIACRISEPLSVESKKKISMFGRLNPEQVFSVHDVSSVYHVPHLLREQGVGNFLWNHLHLGEIEIKESMRMNGKDIHKRWVNMTSQPQEHLETVTIALIGKYTDSKDSYMSVIQALRHAAFRISRKLEINWVDSGNLQECILDTSPAIYHDAWLAVVGADGVIVPGGFGSRGTEGMIQAIKKAREQKIPFLGICLGFQLAVIEWARNVLKITDAASFEFDEFSPHHVIIHMPEISRTHLGGTMRLGLRPTIFQPGTETWSRARMLYGNVDTIWERHRHRYEVNPDYVDELNNSGLLFSGRDEEGKRMQVLELRDHPFFMALQAHPEFCTRPLNPSPPFLGLVAAAASNTVLTEQLDSQITNYKPPHAQSAMIEEVKLRTDHGLSLVNGDALAVDLSYLSLS